MIPFTLAAPGPVHLAVYDLLGREVAVLVDGPMAAGAHEVLFEASTLPGSTYLVWLGAAGERRVQRLSLAR